MSRLLTIALPSYNRAVKLDRQLGWVFKDMQGYESECEVLISDNASPDNTPAVCQKWKEQFESRGVVFRVNRNEQNILSLPNISRCIEMAQTRFVWVIGDDDEIDKGTLGFVIEHLKAHPDLASIVINFRGVGMTTYDRCYHFDGDRLADGREIIEECLRQSYFGLAFMTSQVYRTEFGQASLKAWPAGKQNYDYQVFITSYAGLQGPVLVTRDTHVSYVTGDNVYEKNKRVGLILYADSLQVFLHLRRVGFGPSLCRTLAMKHLWGLKKRFMKRALQNNPITTLTTVARATGYLFWLMLPAA